MLEKSYSLIDEKNDNDDEDFNPTGNGCKRYRRKKAELDQVFPCTVEGCKLTYGSDNALNQHIWRKHMSGQQTGTSYLSQENLLFME